jgi:tripartite-type tricarboxylate transporter receptor subunit TctC
LQPNLTPREPMRELAPVGMVFRSAFVLHVHPSVPARSAAEFIAHCKAEPGKVNFGSSGTGAVNHLCQALFARRAGIEVVHVPFRGGAPALLELRQGRIQAMFQAVQEALPVLREGATRGLAISSAERSPLLPDVPPVADTLPGFDAVFWQGLFAPVGTPEPVVARLGAALRAATDDPALRARMAEQGVSVQTGDAAMLRDLLARETESWGRLIREAGIKPD